MFIFTFYTTWNMPLIIKRSISHLLEIQWLYKELKKRDANCCKFHSVKYWRHHLEPVLFKSFMTTKSRKPLDTNSLMNAWPVLPQGTPRLHWVWCFNVSDRWIRVSTTDHWIRWWWCDQFNHNEDPKQKMGWFGDWTNPITQLRHYIVWRMCEWMGWTKNLLVIAICLNIFFFF